MMTCPGSRCKHPHLLFPTLPEFPSKNNFGSTGCWATSSFPERAAERPGYLHARAARDWAREGWSCARGRDLLGALQRFQRALDGDVDCCEAWLGLSQIFVDLNDTRRAIRCLEVARSLRRRQSGRHPGDPHFQPGLDGTDFEAPARGE